MLKITLLCVGKIKEKAMKGLIEEYVKRLSAYCRLNIVEVPDESCPEQFSTKEQELLKEREGEKLLGKLPKNAWIIPLEIQGKSLSSPQLAVKVQGWQNQGQSHLCFVIGGSLGLGSNLLKRGNYSLSFSAMTFPHQLMRVMTLEQIYRAFRIMRNEPYHK